MSDIQTADPATGNQGDVQVQEQEGGSLLTGLSIPEIAAPSPEAPASQEAAKEGKPQRPAWKAQLPKELQDDTRLDRFPTIGELGKAYNELEGKLGASITLPGKDATAEELDAYYGKIGRPEKPDSYNLTKVELPEGLGYDENLAVDFKKTIHAAGLTQDQADAVYQWQINSTIQAYKDRQADMKQAAAESVATLREEYGTKTAEMIANTTRFIKQAADRFDPSLIRDIEASGLGNSVAFIKLMNSFASLTGEDTFTGEGSGKNVKNDGLFDYSGI